MGSPFTEDAVAYGCGLAWYDPSPMLGCNVRLQGSRLRWHMIPHLLAPQESVPDVPQPATSEAAGHGRGWAGAFARTMKVSHRLTGHAGCVNSIEFNGTGSLLLSGSDDTTVCIYDTVGWELRTQVRTLHRRNIFNAQFVPGTSDTKIVSCGLDGATVLTHTASETPGKVLLQSPVHFSSRVVVSPQHPQHCLVSHGAGGIAIVDFRLERAVATVFAGLRDAAGACTGIAQHPSLSHVVAIGSDSALVSLLDVRRALSFEGRGGSTAAAAPALESAAFLRLYNRALTRDVQGVGGLNFSARGDRLVASYKGGDVVAYDWESAVPFSDRRRVSAETSHDLNLDAEAMLCRYAAAEAPATAYRGRENKLTMFKDAVFLADDALVATGGDCGNIFLWDAHTARLTHKLRGDNDIVNGVAAHPALAEFVACGIDSTVKVVAPSMIPYGAAGARRGRDDNEDAADGPLGAVRRAFRERRSLSRIFSPSREDDSDATSVSDQDASDETQDEETDEEDEDDSSASDTSSSGSSLDMHRMIAHQLVGLFTLTSAHPARGGFRGLYYELRQRLQFVRDLCAMESRLDNSDGDDNDEDDGAAEDGAAFVGAGDSETSDSDGSAGSAASTPRARDQGDAASHAVHAPTETGVGSAEVLGDDNDETDSQSGSASHDAAANDEGDEVSDVALVTQLLQSVRRLDTLAHNLVQQLKRMRVMSPDPASPTIRDEEIPEPPESRTETSGTDIGTWMLHVAVTATEMVQLALSGRAILARDDAECLAALEAQELKILMRRAQLDAAMGRNDAAFESVNEVLAIDGRSVDGIVLAARLALRPDMGIDTSYLVQLQGQAQAALRRGMMPPSSRAVLRRLVDDLQRDVANRRRRRG